jgi:hypothetical protein
MNQDFINISLPKNTRSRKTYGYKFSETQTRPSEGTMGFALARPNHDYVWQCVKPWAHWVWALGLTPTTIGHDNMLRPRRVGYGQCQTQP